MTPVFRAASAAVAASALALSTAALDGPSVRLVGGEPGRAGRHLARIGLVGVADGAGERALRQDATRLSPNRRCVGGGGCRGGGAGPEQRVDEVGIGIACRLASYIGGSIGQRRRRRAYRTGDKFGRSPR